MIHTASIFRDHGVFAAGEPIVVFGSGTGDGCVTFAGNQAEIICFDGKWMAELPPMNYGGPYELVISMSGEVLTLHDIYVGNVYLLIGQSNAAFMMFESNTPESSYSDDSLLRIFKVNGMREIDIKNMNEDDGWSMASVDNIGNWNAIGYLAGKNVRIRDNVPVGILACCQGASVIESWLPKGEAVEFGLSAEDKHPDHFSPLYGYFNKDGFIYNNMFSKIIPYRVTKAIWYQGESDTSAAEGRIYEYEVKKLFEIIRRNLNQPDLEFIVVQIADYTARNDEGWKAIQEAQLRIPQIMNGVSTVISADVCENNMIHPQSKQKLSERITELL